MRKIFQKQFISIITSLIVITALFSGCDDIFDNPLKDKETGENINLFIFDFNFFNTRMTYKLQDEADGSIITAPATISFSGKNGNDIVTYSGKKQTLFTTSSGQLELTVDPNIEITENTPFEFAVEIEIEGYNILNKGIQLQSKGKKTIELHLSKISDEYETDLTGDINIDDGDTTIIFNIANSNFEKSARVEENPYEISYEITFSDFLKLMDVNGNLIFNTPEDALLAFKTDSNNFATMTINSFSDYSPGIDVINLEGILVSVLFQKLETGKMEKLKVNGKVVADLNGGVISTECTFTGNNSPDIFGFGIFPTQNWEMLGTETVYDSLYFSYTLIKASDEQLCETGSSITFRSNVLSSFSINADVYDMEENLLTTINFIGSFPETFVVENTPNEAVKLVFRENNPAFEPIPSLEIDNFCTGSYEVNVTPSSGYIEHQIVLKAFCPNNPTVAVAPTYSGEIKIKNSDNPWQGIDMTGGIVDLLGLPDQEYQLRLLWENEWEYSTFYTSFDEFGNYLHETGLRITSEKMEDGRIKINIEQTFDQNICDNLGL